MNDYSALKAELANDPSNLGYSGMTDAQVASADGTAGAINTVNIDAFVDVPATSVQGLWYASGAWAKVLSRSYQPLTGGAGDAAILAAIGFREEVFAKGTFGTSNASIRSRVITDLGALQTAGDLAPTDVSAAEGLWSVKVSRASQIGWPAGVSTTDVTHARSM